MIKKRDLIKYIINNGFIKVNSYSECYESTNLRVYYIAVRSRAKSGWTHVFINKFTHERLEFHNNWIELHSMISNTCLECRLNIINENIISSIIDRFLRK